MNPNSSIHWEMCLYLVPTVPQKNWFKWKIHVCKTFKKKVLWSPLILFFNAVNKKMWHPVIFLLGYPCPPFSLWFLCNLLYLSLELVEISEMGLMVWFFLLLILLGTSNNPRLIVGKTAPKKMNNMEFKFRPRWY